MKVFRHHLTKAMKSLERKATFIGASIPLLNVIQRNTRKCYLVWTEYERIYRKINKTFSARVV